MRQLKQDLQDIQNQNKDKIQFTFYDGKNNIAIQDETLDSLLKSNIDLFIINLANTEESVIKDFILKVKQKNVPVIVLEAFPQVISEISKYYDKVAFVGTADTKQAGIEQGKILVDQWNNNKEIIDKNNDNILQYILLKGEAGNPVADERTSYSISKINDAMAIGAIKGLQKYGYNTGDKFKYVSVVGIDAIPEARELVDKGIMTGTVIQDSKLLAEGLYKVGVNLINGEEHIANTNYKIVNGLIEIPMKYQQYVMKAN